MQLDTKIFDILACPICKGKLYHDRQKSVLICKFHKVAYPIKDGCPVLLFKEAMPLHDNQSGKL